MSYDGENVTYDTIGNPNSLNGRSYVWEHGRELRKVTYGGTEWTNTYDVNGLRAKREGGGKTYSYTYNGSLLSRMTVGDDTLTFFYDASGNPLSLIHNGTTYYYATNLQGDVVALLNTSGTAVVTYTYDAWGKLLETGGSMASTLGALNPLRYRGYVYDTETGLYYLQSRYYDPEVGRFINADGLVATGVGLLGNNMFAYCNNNPSNFKDTGGYLPISSGIVSPQISRYELVQTGNGNITEEKDDNSEKVFKVVKSLWTNFEFSFGIGMGFEIENTILDFLGFTIGMHGNLVHVQLEDGELSCGQEYNSGVAVTALFYNYGFVEYKYNKDFIFAPVEVYKGLYADDTVTIFSISGYLEIGGNIRIGFDLVNFLSEMDQLFWG